MCMTTPISTGKRPTPTWWQEHGSRALTRVFHDILGQPSRSAHAGSIREQALKLTEKQKTDLNSLLIKHKLLQPEYEKIDPEKLQHFHFCVVVSDIQIKAFIKEANDNQIFGQGFEIAYIAGQFNIIKRVVIPAPPILPSFDESQLAITPSVQALIVHIMFYTNRPLSLAQIREEVAREGLRDVTPEALGIEIGKLIGRGTVAETFAEKEENRRFFMPERHLKMMLDNRTIFEYETAEGEKKYIYHKEAAALAQAGKAFRFLDPECSIVYMAAERFEIYKEFTTEVKTDKASLFVFNHDLDQLLKKGLILTGLEEGNFEDCYIHHESQRQYPFQIFNAFARAYLDFDEKGSVSQYKQLRTAFEAGLKFEKPVSIADFLYEAKILAGMNAGQIAIAVALAKRPEAIAQLKKTGHFKEIKLREMADCFEHLAFISRFPALFAPEQPDSLQNSIDFIYDKSATYNVFLLLLAVKLGQIRKLAATGKKLPPSLQREIELIYAPLAESKYFIDLSNSMRDLVARLTDPQKYVMARDIMERTMGMGFDEARRHLRSLAGELIEDIATDPKCPEDIPGLKAWSRVKEVYAMKKESMDYLGIRIICRDIRDVYQIISFLMRTLKQPAIIPNSKKTIENHLERPNENGWKGWRGYFYDPKSSADTKNQRIISIQVMTEQMEKDDKRGEAAHWGYKAERAADATAASIKKRYRKQILNASTDQYIGNSQDDYYADQKRAREHIRAFVWPFGQDFSARSFEFPPDGCVPSLRLKAGATIKQALSSAGFDNILDQGGYVELYEFYFDEASDSIKIRPAAKGLPRVGVDYIVPNAALMVIRPEEGPRSQRGRRA